MAEISDLKAGLDVQMLECQKLREAACTKSSDAARDFRSMQARFEEQAAPAGEEETAGDVDDPLAMVSGMGDVAVYKVSLLDEAVGRQEEPAEVVPAVPDDEGGDVGDVDDPFAMMSCMGEGAICTVTLVEEALERQEE
ncbi:MAG: hypothetical protein ACKPKO_37395, partial [Candidatus Fonsibacter sp.]